MTPKDKYAVIVKALTVGTLTTPAPGVMLHFEYLTKPQHPGAKPGHGEGPSYALSVLQAQALVDQILRCLGAALPPEPGEQGPKH